RRSSRVSVFACCAVLLRVRLCRATVSIMSSQAIVPPPRARLVLVLLLLAYIFNFLDRQILGILGPAIKADLHLGDTQLGAVGGPGFALLYSLLAVPLAYLADRTSRSGVVAGAVAVWSAFTALCGTATGFGQLFLYRLGVGVGEAGGGGPAFSGGAAPLPAARRARARSRVYT